MTLPTWEIVCLTLAVLGIAGVCLYFLIRCWKSMRILRKQDSNPRPRQNGRCMNTTADVTQVYGVPYRSPTPPQPQPLDPAKLHALVMEAKSDLHPKYLEYNDGLGDRSDSSHGSHDHRVTWNGESALLESAFMPSMTESPVVEVTRSSGAVMSGSPTKPRKIVHISYDRGQDGAPEIMNITTDTITYDDDVTTDTIDVVKNSTPISARSEQMSIDLDEHVAQVDHVTLDSPKTLLKAPQGRWISFDENTPTVVIHDEHGCVQQRLEFDA